MRKTEIRLPIEGESLLCRVSIVKLTEKNYDMTEMIYYRHRGM